jgi:hypothetical protein
LSVVKEQWTNVKQDEATTVTTMSAFETSAIVESNGQLHVTGIPFQPGTEVSITIREKASADATHAAANLEGARARMRELFERLRGRNTEPIGPLHRDELYDRKVFR